ncbi:MAG: IPT/TIG domain-containing protein [Acidobacteriota bacterium]
MVACLVAAIASTASAQIWDLSGNNLLSGSWVFRHVLYGPDVNGNITAGAAAYGSITFDGRGNYTLSGTDVQSGGYSISNGTYSLAASSYGFMKHPYTGGTSRLNFLLSNGVILGSSPDSLINDLFVAVPAGSANNGTFQGSYSMAYLNIAPTVANTFNSIAALNPNGNGNIGTVPVKTYLGGQATPINQNENGVSYTFSSGIGTLRFPTTSNLALRGNLQMFISADGNFIFGGSAAGFDIFIGVKRSGGTAPAMSGLYYTAGLNHIPGGFDSYFGSFFALDGQSANPGGLWEHQRFLASYAGAPINYTAAGEYPAAPVNDYTDSASAVEYVISQDARFRIGIGLSPYMTLRVAVHAPSFSPPGANPWIDPSRIQNAASSAPFTAGVSRGELLTIYGSNLAGGTVVTPSLPFPTTLGKVQVLMNNKPAPIYYVSPSQISVIVPYGISDSVVQIQVVNDGVNSNAVTAFMYLTGPGVFSQPQTGHGTGAILHSDYSIVTGDNPVRPGENLSVYLTGLGDVFPAIQDGAPGPVDQLSKAVASVAASMDGREAAVSYAGLAPTLSGLYQVNLTVPVEVSAGDVFLDISTPDGITSEVTVPVVLSGSEAKSRQAKPFIRRR